MTTTVYLPLLGQLNKRQYPVTQDQFNSILNASTLANYSSVITPEQFGAKGDGITDDTAAFAALATYVNASAPDATISFKPGANYAVWPTDPGSVYLMQFTGTNGLTINFNGAKIISAMPSSAEENYVLGFTGTNNNITINNPHYEQTILGNTTPVSPGGILVAVVDNTTNLTINNLYMIGGEGGIAVTRTAATNRASNIVMNGAYFRSVYYPLNFRKNGDNFTGQSIYATNVGRMYFPYNVKHHRVQFTNNYVANVLPTVLIGLVTLSTENADLNTTEDIHVDATFTSSAPLTNGMSYADINFEQGDATSAPGTVKDIYFHLVGTTNGVGAGSNAFVIHKANFAGASDTATRGYVLDNVELGGKLDWGYGPVQTASLFNTGDTWTASGGTSSIAAGTNSFTGSIAGNVLTASAVTGTIYLGTSLVAGTIIPGTQVLSQLTGSTGGAGTYVVSVSQTVASTSVSGTYGLLTMGGSITGTFAVGDILSGTGVVANTYITAFGTGSGGAGTYAVNNNTVVSSTSIAASDVVRNVGFRNLVAVNSIAANSITATLTNLQGPFYFENVTVDQPIALTGAGANVVSRNVTTPSGLAASQQGPTVLNGTLTMGAYAYANLPSLLSGMTTVIIDSPTNVLGATITVGSGGNTVLAWYGNGRWTVIGK